MIPSVVLSAWYIALFGQNCVKVLELLKDYPQLLKHGWSEDSRREVEGRFSRSQKRGCWKGRTALHVGARRGSVELVETVVGMFVDVGNPSNETIQVVISDPAISFEDLLAAKDGEYELDALAMAVVNGKRDIILILVKGSLSKCRSNPYEIPSGWEAPGAANGPSAIEANTNRSQLRKVTEEVMENLAKSRSADAETLKAFYEEVRDFNFLPWEEYLFHSTFVSRPKQMFELLDEVRRDIFNRARFSPSLNRFLCELQDGQGRTAFHVAVDEGTVQQFLSLCPKGHDFVDFLSARDGAGRAPLHRAAAMRSADSLQHLMGDNRVDLNQPFCPWEYAESLRADMGIDVERLSNQNGFKGFGWFDVYDSSFALHIAIIHKRRECVRLLLDDKYNTYHPQDCILDLTLPCTRLYDMRGEEVRRLALEPLQLAALVGDESILEMLLANVRARDPGRPSKSSIAPPNLCIYSNPWPAIHLVAGSGKYKLLRLFLDSKNYDPLVGDFYENTTLHHATKGREFQFHSHLLDVSNISYRAVDSRRENEGDREAVRKEQVERQGCIELLLRAGFDIWKANKANQAPYPGPDATAEFLSWWYKKLSKEAIAMQSTLNAAANAISVTATLVATASFAGLLQPPLGWSSSDDQMQVSSLAMRIFIVCDTLSFYLAVAAIMLALLPSLPMPQESTLDELRRTQTMVAMVVGSIFPSIISIIIAFSAASIVVISNDGSWNRGGLTIVTTSIGGLICAGVIVLFSIRFLRLVFYKNVRIRRLFRATAF